jgi:hypothetical protein
MPSDALVCLCSLVVRRALPRGGAMYDRWRETIRLPWNGLKSQTSSNLQPATGQTDDQQHHVA